MKKLKNLSSDTKYYKAVVSMGHLGSGHHRESCLYIYARGIMEAMSIAQRAPAVKHSKIPLNIVEITKEEFLKGRKINPYDTVMDQLNNGV